MSIWNKVGIWSKTARGKEMDWKEIAKDRRADLFGSAFYYRTMLRFW